MFYDTTGQGAHHRAVPANNGPAPNMYSGPPSGPRSSGPFDSASSMQFQQLGAIGLSAGQAMFQDRFGRMAPGFYSFWHLLQYYFDVNNSYVSNKLKLILLPFKHKDWKRRGASDDGLGATAKYLPPVHDINAPDLYIPLMAFITYVLLTGLLKGTRMKFTPEVLSEVTTSSIVTQIIEVALIKIVLYVFRLPQLATMDLVAFTGYKYLGLMINTTVGILLGSGPYYVVMLYSCACLAYFSVHTMYNWIPIVQGEAGTTRRNYLCLGVAALQVVLLWWLGYSGDL